MMFEREIESLHDEEEIVNRAGKQHVEYHMAQAEGDPNLCGKRGNLIPPLPPFLSAPRP
jgi:hypothetical protein